MAMACLVAAKHSGRQEVVVHGGGIHLSKDCLNWRFSEGEKTIFGLPVLLRENGWDMPGPNCFVRSLSQEHGVIRCSASFFEKMEIGGLVGILPVHSCMPVNLADKMLTTDGEVMDVIG